MLAEARSLNLPLLSAKHASADFLILADGKSIQKVQFLEGDPALREQGRAIQAALTRDRSPMPEPPDSEAQLLRRRILSCSPAIHSCQFILFLPGDTQLPPPPAAPAPAAPSVASGTGVP